MKAGKLTEAITIQRATYTVNAAGTPGETWASIATLRAEKVEQATTEAIRNFGASDEELVVFRARFLDGITNADRLLWRGAAFNIKQVAPIERRQGVELRCQRVT